MYDNLGHVTCSNISLKVNIDVWKQVMIMLRLQMLEETRNNLVGFLKIKLVTNIN